MSHHYFKNLLSLLLTMGMMPLAAQVAINFNLGQRGPEISDTHYGIFYEEINHAGDGGLYAELIRNRSFEDNTSNPDYWSVNGSASMALTSTGLMNSAQNEALQVTFIGNGSGIRNSGYWGISFLKDSTYKLTFWAKANTNEYNGTLTARLLSSLGSNCGTATINGPFSTSWTKYTAIIVPTRTITGGIFGLTASISGSITFDMISLFPPTFNGHANGCRTDLAQKLADLNPGFIRFPGGCYIEGQYSNGLANRFEWKKSVGPIETRPGHLNVNWGYRVTDGMGYHEFLQLCEDLHAKPLFVTNVGIGHGWYQDYQQIDSFIQEALDAIEYANGDSTTKYGAMRIANGHPNPFNLDLMEIGNENYNFYADNNNDQSDHYAERYHAFYTAIKEKYPYMTLIGNVQAWGTDAPTWRNSYPVEMVDEHYYRNPGWFINNYNKYDTYSRLGYKVYSGEYAVTSNFGTTGNLNAAIGEAVYMQGMENNSDVCKMASYAPIFVNENNQVWAPDMIRFNTNTSFGTPSYYVQKLFANNTGKTNIKWTESNNKIEAASGGKIGFASWLTSVTFDQVNVTDKNGNSLVNETFDNVTNWTNGTGTWVCADGTYSQTDANSQGGSSTFNTVLQTDTFTYSLDAVKNSGKEGFLIIFNYQDADNYCWWNLGGWSNTALAVEQCINGSKSTLASVSGSITTGQAYKIKIIKTSTNVKCYLDNVLIHDFTMSVRTKGVYVASSINDDSQTMYIKLVNPNSRSLPSILSFKNGTINSGDAIVLTSTSGNDENTMSNPNKVIPSTASITVNNNNTISYTVPAYSVNILRLNTSDIKIEPDDTIGILPLAAVKYSFLKKKTADDDSIYVGTFKNGAGIMTMSDNNYVLSTGNIGDGGYMDLGTKMPKAILSSLSGSYTISIDILNHSDNKLDNYCWGYAIANGTTNYMGLVNTAGNTNWYYEIKNGSLTQVVKSGVGLSTDIWHNFTYVQDGENGKVYIDGILASTGSVSIKPSDFASLISGCYIGKSPYSADAVVENAFFDNFQIFDSALNPQQVKTIYNQTSKMCTTLISSGINPTINDTQAIKNGINVYNTDGRMIKQNVTNMKVFDGLTKGTYIIDGKKIVVK